jgi:hypothetical protein
MTAIAGMQALSMPQATAEMPATSNSKVDSNSMTSTAGTQATTILGRKWRKRVVFLAIHSYFY